MVDGAFSRGTQRFGRVEGDKWRYLPVLHESYGLGEGLALDEGSTMILALDLLLFRYRSFIVAFGTTRGHGCNVRSTGIVRWSLRGRLCSATY